MSASFWARLPLSVSTTDRKAPAVDHTHVGDFAQKTSASDETRPAGLTWL